MPRQKKTTPPAPGQMEFDYPRGKRKEWLLKLLIPEFTYFNSRGTEIRVVDTTKMLMLLRLVEDHSGGFAPGTEDRGCDLKRETIAREIGCKPRKRGASQRVKDLDLSTVSRTVAACENFRSNGRPLPLLNVSRQFHKDKASHYTVNWFGVKQLILDDPDTEHLINEVDPIRLVKSDGSDVNNGNDGSEDHNSHDSHASHDERAIESQASEGALVASETIDFTNCKSEVTTCNLPFTHCKLPFTPCKLPLETQPLTTSSRARGFNHERNHEKKPCAAERELEPFAGVSGWPQRIMPEHLRDRWEIERLFQHAIKANYVAEFDRLRFFTLAVYVSRGSKDGRILRAGGYFTAQLKNRNWLGDERDVKQALDWVSQVDSERLQTARRLVQESDPNYQADQKAAREDFQRRYPQLFGLEKKGSE